MNNVLELAVKPRLVLKLEGKELTLEYDIPAVIQAEEDLKQSLKSLTEWFALKWDAVPVLLHAGLKKHHPEMTLVDMEHFCNELGTEGVLEVLHALICLNFPRAMARAEAALRKGTASPNAAGAGGR